MIFEYCLLELATGLTDNTTTLLCGTLSFSINAYEWSVHFCFQPSETNSEEISESFNQIET
jgi:hypothetical protein